jgi:hypothetical protein
MPICFHIFVCHRSRGVWQLWQVARRRGPREFGWPKRCQSAKPGKHFCFRELVLSGKRSRLHAYPRPAEPARDERFPYPSKRSVRADRARLTRGEAVFVIAALAALAWTILIVLATLLWSLF